jgi:hypothetical protein
MGTKEMSNDCEKAKTCGGDILAITTAVDLPADIRSELVKVGLSECR